jgi:hypothetical protein
LKGSVGQPGRERAVGRPCCGRYRRRATVNDPDLAIRAAMDGC